MSRADVVIVGGGVVGCSVAYHLLTEGFGVRVVVVERDPAYTRASSALAMGGIRQQFSSALNVSMVQTSLPFWRDFDERMARAGHAARANFRQRGYLFLVEHAQAPRFEERIERQRSCGAHLERLDLDALRALVPGLFVDDLAFGVLGPEDGYAEPRQVLDGFRSLAIDAGTEFMAGEVVAVARSGDRVGGVTLKDGERIDTEAVVNAAGAWAAQLGAMAGLDLPIRPVRQHLFCADLTEPWPHRFPMVVDPTGVHWRHRDAAGKPDRIVVAKTRIDEPAGENFECDASRWESEFLPPLLRRMPGLRGLKMERGWVGLYEMTPDHNPLLGTHPSLAGFHLACGFSGHGLMMSPATGKMISEMIRLGRAETVDVAPLRPDRFERGEPFHDEAMI